MMFVHPKTGETYWWILPYVNTQLFNQVLADFGREFELGTKKHILLAVDRAGWHISREVKIPPGLHLTFLPLYSLELQPAERLWALVDEPITNQSFDTLDDERRRFILPMPILTKAARFNSRINWFSLVD